LPTLSAIAHLDWNFKSIEVEPAGIAAICWVIKITVRARELRQIGGR